MNTSTTPFAVGIQTPTVNYLQTPRSLNENLSREMYSILDSRIQYLKFLISEVMKGYVDMDLLEENSPIASVSLNYEEVMKNNGLIFDLLEGYNRSIRLMLFIRQKLNAFNAGLVLNLMNNKRYLSFTEEQLLDLFQKGKDLEPSHVSDNETYFCAEQK